MYEERLFRFDLELVKCVSIELLACVMAKRMVEGWVKVWRREV
jgi:hypothetical protein